MKWPMLIEQAGLGAASWLAIVEDRPERDQRLSRKAVADADARGRTLRVLCTAASASRTCNPGCDLGDALISGLDQNHSECSPRVRAEIEDNADECAVWPTASGWSSTC